MKSYTIAEVQPDGRVYAMIERDDGSTFGQAVDVRGAQSDAEIETAIRAAVDTAELIEIAITKLSQPPMDLSAKLGVRRAVAPKAQ